MRLCANVIFRSKMRICIFLLSLLLVLPLSAEKLPRKVEKAALATVSVLTYKEGVLKSSGTGVYVGGNGNLISSYPLFVGCDSAVVVDAKGVVRRVQRVVGVNELYDCIKLRTADDKKIFYLQLSEHSFSSGDNLFLLPYGGNPELAAISDVTIYGGNPYYTLSLPMQERFLAAPLVDAQGCVVALMQPASSYDKENSYAVSAKLADELKVAPMDFSSSKINAVGIECALPDKQSEALTTLHLMKLSYGNRYFVALDDYIDAYPKSYEGYMLKAEKSAVFDNDRNAAERLWKKAVSLSEKPDDVYYNKATTLLNLMNKAAEDSVAYMKLADEALECLDKAYNISDEPLYMQSKGELLYSLGKYDEAFPCFVSLYRTNMSAFDTFAKALNCKVALGDYSSAAEQMDSAVVILGESYAPTAAVAKADIYVKAGRYREAVLEYNKYEEKSLTAPVADFYFMRAGIEVQAKMYKQAIDDYDRALALSPDNLIYLLDKGRLYYRVKYVDEALAVFEKMIAIDSELPDAYYIAALCHIQKGENDEAKIKLHRAKELGHPLAEDKLKELE